MVLVGLTPVTEINKGGFQKRMQRFRSLANGITLQINQQGKNQFFGRFNSEIKPLMESLAKSGTRFVGNAQKIVKAINADSIDSLIRSLQCFESGFSGALEIFPFEGSRLQIIPRHDSVFAI